MSKNEFSNELSVCEEMIMSLLLDSKEDLTLQEVTDNMKIRYGKDWKLQTVATFLTRMEKKGFISIYRIGRYSYYHAEYDAKDIKMKALTEVTDLYFHGNLAAMQEFVLKNGKTILPGTTVYYKNEKNMQIEPVEVTSVTLTKEGISHIEVESSGSHSIWLDMKEQNKTWFLSEEEAGR